MQRRGQLAQQQHNRAQYAILVKGFFSMSQGIRRFFHNFRRSPITRIAWSAAFATIVSGCDKLGSGGPAAPTPVPSPGSTITWTAIGASDANGVGSSAPCVPLQDCPNGMGYVPVAARQLRAQGFSVNLLNLGIATAVISRSFESLGQQYNRTILGNFIEQEMPFVQRSATLVTVFAGLNEVNTITAALGGGAGGSDPNGFIDAQVRAFGNDYTTLMRGISELAPSARRVLLNVPNPAGMPYLASASLAQRQAAQRVAVGMTRTVVNPLASTSTAVVDLMCDARSYQPSTYSGDGLHPNDNGYAFIAGEVVRAITTASYAAPQSSCSAMTIVP
jgi:lysophospholipase L1-like esterase